ncbi:metallophosphoesterase [Deinococcus fonticola]|uniref:metallophosphoesterase n=1 Tax=Deinococcus fonticola TaxID=2528713 RepID=UPI0010751E22|nr:metallophosphoesterase [Deinococcus fonticola]
MNSIVVPDLHGCPHFLDWVLLKYPGRHLILLGDLINRGPDARLVMRTALNLARERRATLLWGNHEDWAWAATARLKFPAQERWFKSKGRELHQAYDGDVKACMADLTQFALFAHSYVVEGDMLCAHAARPNLGRDPQDVLDKRCLRDRPDRRLLPLPVQFFPNLRYSVHGHTVMPEPLVDLGGKGVVYLDLGSAKTGKFCVWDSVKREVASYGE